MERKLTLSINKIAQIAHEFNRAYCQATGDYTQPAWKDAPDWQKNSTIEGVKFALANPEVTPEQIHQNWLKGKESEGWQYGEKKNPELKLHPCMMPYKELPKGQKIKDSLFLTAVFEVTKIIEDF